MRAGPELFRTTALLQAPPARDGRMRHLAGGVAANIALLAVLSAVSHRIREPEPEPEPVTVVFYNPATPAPPPKPAPVATAPRALPPPKPVERPEPPRVELEAPRVEPPPRPVPRPAVPEPAPAPPIVPKPEIRTGLFAEAERAAPERGRADRVPARIGGFEVAASPTSSSKSRTRVVVGEGFGEESQAPQRRAPAAGGGAVAVVGFDEAVERPRERKARVATNDTAVEILSKPRPDYTDEARRLRIEGEVVVEVVFFASGRLDVLRILRGLGHGLDEEAMAAVRKIQFTPALRDGVPVDQTAALRVVFRLA